ncbi:basic salivary proline-rich protein 4-like [Solea solea]|uniref:basic salivary proline-rich protein 4-like n=1 Tax=Solea solea TaxID=90069 RepID=UPI00272C9B00|nr:basic salivary proline-rich protein 4-like [Solea solea]
MGVIGIWVGDRANVRPVPSDGAKIIQEPRAPSSRTGQERPTATTPRIATHPSRRGPVGGMRGGSPPHPGSTRDRGRTTPHPGRPQRPRVPAPRARQRPRAGPAHHRGEQSPPQTAYRGGAVRYPPQPPPPPPRSQPHAPQPREGQAEAHVGPPAKGAPRDGREADSRAGPDPPGRGGASGPRTCRAQPHGAPERGPQHPGAPAPADDPRRVSRLPPTTAPSGRCVMMGHNHASRTPPRPSAGDPIPHVQRRLLATTAALTQTASPNTAGG